MRDICYPHQSVYTTANRIYSENTLYSGPNPAFDRFGHI